MKLFQVEIDHEVHGYERKVAVYAGSSASAEAKVRKEYGPYWGIIETKKLNQKKLDSARKSFDDIIR